MGKLRKHIINFNHLVYRINKAESIPVEKLQTYSEEDYIKLTNLLQRIIKQHGELAIKIERIINRPLTDEEKINGINL